MIGLPDVLTELEVDSELQEEVEEAPRCTFVQCRAEIDGEEVIISDDEEADPCTNPAVYYLIMPCCGDVELVCQSCYEDMVDQDYVRCDCGTIHEPGTLTRHTRRL